MIRPALVLILFLVFTVKANGQDQFILKKDLQSDWLINTENKYVPFNQAEKRVTTIYFVLNPDNFKGDYLALTNENHFSVMLNGKLLLDNLKSTELSIDSLKKSYPESPLFFAVHQDNEPIDQANLVTRIQTKVTAASALEIKHRKRETSFRDFSVTAILILFIFLVGVIRLNPRLSSDYFSITKLFSFRDSDIDQFYYRLTSGNILFYVLTSLIFSFYLIVIGQFIKIELTELKMVGYWAYLFVWLKVSALIFALLFLKMFIVYVIASLFGVRDIAGFHFFNFIRLLLIFIGVLAIILTTYHLLHGQGKNFYNFFLGVLGWILGGWVILLFLKLTNRVRYAMFHLFSYICATEIIPFLLIVKVLNE